MDAPSMPPTDPVDRGLSGGAQLVMGLTWFFAILTIPAVGLRFHFRRKFEQATGLDDWIMLFALCWHIVYQTFLTMACIHGLGYSLTTMTVEQIIALSKWAWFADPVNMLVNISSRISIAILLVQIFGIRAWFKRIIIAYTTILALTVVANIALTFAQVSPFQAGWDFRIKTNWRLPTQIHNVIVFVQTILFTVSDFMYAFFPVLFIWKLHMPTRKKVGLMAVMAGSFITMGCAIGRAVLVSDSLKLSTDLDASSAASADNAFLIFLIGGILSSIESSFVIILGSLPKLKAITRLNLVQNLSLSFKSLMSRLIDITQFRSSVSGSNQGWNESNIELNQAHKAAFNRQHVGRSISSVVAASNFATDPTQQAKGIKVTEGYTVIQNMPT